MYLGLLIMCGFVLFDTQLIIEKAENGDKDYVWWGNVLTASKVPMSPLSAGLHFPITKCCANASSHSEPYNWASVLKKSNLMHHIVLSDELAARSTWWCSSVGLTVSQLTDFCSREGDSQLVDNSIFDDDPEATTSSDKRQHNSYLGNWCVEQSVIFSDKSCACGGWLTVTTALSERVEFVFWLCWRSCFEETSFEVLHLQDFKLGSWIVDGSDV